MPLKHKLLFCVVVAGLIAASPTTAEAQTTWYVDNRNCPGPGSGTQADPFCTIQDGIDAAIDGEEVVVADGIYTGASNRPIISGKGITVRSANGPKNCVIDCQLQGRGFTVLPGGLSATQIRGFTIINGSASYGGGIYSAADEMVIAYCIIRNCAATNDPPDIVEGGGGINVRGQGEVSITNCLITGNTAVTRGGGIFGKDCWPLNINNCTISGNSAAQGGGVFFYDCEGVMGNSIFWDNSAPSGAEGYLYWAGNYYVRYCDVEGGQNSFVVDPDSPGPFYFCWGFMCSGWGMLDADPLFVDPNNNDYHLQADSPCIDTGRNDYVTEFSSSDLDGEPRIFNRRVDIGADEHLDCNNNGILDFQDIAAGTSDDCNENEIPDECEGDCNQNDIADECDIADGTSLDNDNNGVPDECGDTLHVPAGYPTIQLAVDAADNGYTVLVADGYYTGISNRPEIDYKAITLLSENGPENCVIDCQHKGRGITVWYHQTSGTRIEGFTIINGYANYGGGIYASGHDVRVNEIVIANCIIRDNECGTYHGGGIHCRVVNPTIINCTVTGNTSQGWGGGIFCETNYPTITNCTITGNTAVRGGGIVNSGRDMTIRNCILRGNSAPTGPEGYLYWSGDTYVSYCNVEGGLDSFANNWVGNGNLFWGDGNIDADPLFTDPNNDDYHLQAGSPCIDVGDPNFEPIAGESDVDGEPRVGDGDGDEEAPGVYATVDLGADEYLDCNGNGIPDYQDITDETSADCNENFIPDECEPYDDCNNNGIQDLCDMADGTSPDCNENDIPDECDISEGMSEDCNANGMPDECEIPSIFTSSSLELTPIGNGDPQSYTINSPPQALSAVTLSFRAIAALNGSSRYINVDINGIPVGTIFESGANYCPSTPDEAQITVSAETYNIVASGGQVVINMVATSEVHPAVCNPEQFISVTLEYEVSGTSEDCNDNYIPDECEGGPWYYGDVDGNGDVNVMDLLCLLDGLAGVFNCPGVAFENLDIWPCLGGDGDLNLLDLFAMLDALAGQPPCPEPCP